ncbi:MAG: hypothetical protein R3F30_12130 [Planctomycetota bacterium]
MAWTACARRSACCDLLDRGHLPLRSGRHCGTCEFQATCPRHHAPTSERLAAVEDLAAFRGLRRKGKDAPLLAMLGPLGDDDADEEDEA